MRISDVLALRPVDPSKFAGMQKPKQQQVDPRMQQMLMQKMMQDRQAKERNFGALGNLLSFLQQTGRR
jgi:hypothetical protein|tara:strand:+ start:404 stop:607 length:204 start_codon:yes stop_codon:yes gene_type:complete